MLGIRISILYYFDLVMEQWLCFLMLEFLSVPFGKGSKTSYFGYGTILFKHAVTPEQCLLCFVFGHLLGGGVEGGSKQLWLCR